MNDFARRDVIAVITGLAAATGVLASCAATAGIDAQVMADVQGLESTVGAVLAAVEQYDPTAISGSVGSNLASLENAANAALSSLTSATPVATGATTLQTIDSFLNGALQAIGAALPAASAAFPVLLPFVPMYDAAVALVTGVLEPYINSLLSQIGGATTTTTPTPPPVTTTPAAVALHVVHAHFTPRQARAVLRIPNMHTPLS